MSLSKIEIDNFLDEFDDLNLIFFLNSDQFFLDIIENLISPIEINTFCPLPFNTMMNV